MKNKLFIVLLLTIISLPLLGGTNNRLKYKDYIKFQNGLGLTYSNMTGTGICYHRQFNDKYQLKTSNLLYYSNENETESRIYVGTEIDRFFFSSDYIRCYFLTGTAFSFEDDKDKSIQRKLHLGTGVGMEIFSTQHIRINIDIGYQYYHRLDNEKNYVGFGAGIGTRFVY